MGWEGEIRVVEAQKIAKKPPHKRPKLADRATYPKYDAKSRPPNEVRCLRVSVVCCLLAVLAVQRARAVELRVARLEARGIDWHGMAKPFDPLSEVRTLVRRESIEMFDRGDILLVRGRFAHSLAAYDP